VNADPYGNVAIPDGARQELIIINTDGKNIKRPAVSMIYPRSMVVAGPGGDWFINTPDHFGKEPPVHKLLMDNELMSATWLMNRSG
jgi:hypothetical protein